MTFPGTDKQSKDIVDEMFPYLDQCGIEKKLDTFSRNLVGSLNMMVGQIE